ncbi:endothelin-converting enzyme 1-like [Diaphorina citri]|uniref:Endothelin-converting enzyme 1-like n=1 Tax=Diaphorina citri TaxID=121845 RepID=A0A3Q0JPA4_DIACI|nr:endothelin-converting enzyme 1-like [Diaphorina citri]
MNPTIEPCRDFYQYACDHFSVAEVQNEYYEPAQLSLTTLHKFIDAQLQDLLFKSKDSDTFKKLGEFYESCVNSNDENNLKQMYKILDELGGYLPPNAPSTELTHLVRRILQIYSSPLFDVYLDRSLLDPNETLSIYVDLPKRFVTSRHFMETNVSGNMYKILDELGGYLPPNAPSTELTHLVRRNSSN